MDLDLTESERIMLQRCADTPGLLHPHDFNEQGQALLMHLIRRRLLGLTGTPEHAASRRYFLTDAGREALTVYDDAPNVPHAPLPQPGELWELHYPGYPRFHLRIDRITGNTTIGSVEWADTSHPRYQPGHALQHIPLTQWDAYQPQKIEEQAAQ
jgi:hypothetical protein